jgi:hypothetical protein
VWDLKNGGLQWKLLPLPSDEEVSMVEERVRRLEKLKAERERKIQQADAEAATWEGKIRISFESYGEPIEPINRSTFDEWHANAIQRLIEREPRLTVGWAAKIINVYLKTRVYVGAQGRHHLKEMIHPPIAVSLWIGLARRFHDRPDILERTNCVSRIEDIVDYDLYRRIIG